MCVCERFFTNIYMYMYLIVYRKVFVIVLGANVASHVVFSILVDVRRLLWCFI